MILGLSRNILRSSGLFEPTSTEFFTFLDSTSFVGAINGGSTGAVDTTDAKLIVISLTGYAAMPTPAISDNKGNVWTPLTQYIDSLNVIYNQLYYCINPTVGAGHIFTCAGATSFSSINVQWFNCSSTPSFGLVTGTSVNGAMNTLQLPIVTPSFANALFVTGLSPNQPDTVSGNITINQSFIKTAQVNYSAGSHFGSSMAYFIRVGNGSKNPVWSWYNGTETGSSIAIFKPEL